MNTVYRITENPLPWTTDEPKANYKIQITLNWF